MYLPEKRKEMVEKYGASENAAFFDNESYDDSITGVTDDGRIIYSYDKMVVELAKEYGWKEDETGMTEKEKEENYSLYMDAVEWIDYNTLRAYCPSDMLMPRIMAYNPDTEKEECINHFDEDYEDEE